MDYKLKYLKYKQKYLALKEQDIFAQGDSFKDKYFKLKTEYEFALKQGGKIDSAGIGIKYTKEDYNKSIIEGTINGSFTLFYH